MTRERKPSITIDNRQVEVRPGLTILQAARAHGIYIPSLCAFEHLPSYGACRLCVVEVDGLRGFPTSCTTPVEDGMVIRTDTSEIRSLRQEILKLLLSEHPASCLFCTERTECEDFQGTIRKSGVITGCQYCPNNARCELQQITERIGLTETSYPVYYRNLPVEQYDPFYDRDYNLCILCGRCVRVCNSVRLNGTLSFKQRGKATTVGPAFDRTHLEAGCEFCGACVSVCPTGALAAKVSKWYGKPEKEVDTTCVYCPLGCTLKLQVRKNEVIDAIPDYDSPVDRGLICMKGRFAVPEYVHSPLRIIVPKRLTSAGYQDITWDEATTEVAQQLGAIKPDEFLMVVSPQMMNEDYFAAQQFARKVIGSQNIRPSLCDDLIGNTEAFINLANMADDIDAIYSSGVIFAIGFDSTYGYSPIGIAIKTAVRQGAVLVVLDSEDTNLDMISDASFKCAGKDWPDFLGLMSGETPQEAVRRFPGWKKDIAQARRMFEGTLAKIVVAGPGTLGVPSGAGLFERLMRLKETKGWRLIAAHPYTNLKGMLAMGAFPGMKPGELVARDGDSEPVRLDAHVFETTKRRKVIYALGEANLDNLPPCDYLIYQNPLPAGTARKPDLVLPSSLFTETPGTMINGEGRILSVNKATDPAGQTRPDWAILSAIAVKMKSKVMRYGDMRSLQREIGKYMKGFPSIRKRVRFRPLRVEMKFTGEVFTGAYDGRQSFRGIPLSTVVSGMILIEERSRRLSAEGKEAT